MEYDNRPSQSHLLIDQRLLTDFDFSVILLRDVLPTANFHDRGRIHAMFVRARQALYDFGCTEPYVDARRRGVMYFGRVGKAK